LFVFLIESLDVYKAGLAIIYVFFDSLQTIGTPNLTLSFFFFRPRSLCFGTSCAKLVSSQVFVLITKWYSEINKVHCFYKTIDVTSLGWQSEATAEILENIWVIATYPALGSHRNVNYYSVQKNQGKDFTNTNL